MKTNNFYACDSADSVQLRYDELCKIFSDHEPMLQALKEEYSTLMAVLAESKPVETEKEKATVSEKIKELQESINPEGLHIEIIKDWLWISGRTFQVKDTLKKLGFRYSANKLCWYYRQVDPKLGIDHRSGNQEPIPLEMIREKYGSNEVALR